MLGLANLDIPNTVEGEDISDLIKNPDTNADRTALVMGIIPFADNRKGAEYRLVRTKQYTFERQLEGPTKLFDNMADPYQMDNLVGKPEYAELQARLDAELTKKLKAVGDELRPKDYYLEKWGYVLDEKKMAIDYWSFKKGKGVVQTPKKQY